jgi:hypothetical protein
MPPAGFEPTIPTSERSQTHASDQTATGIGTFPHIMCNIRLPPVRQGTVSNPVELSGVLDFW